MLQFHPTGSDAEIEPATGHLVDGDRVLGNDRGVAKRDGGDEDTEPDVGRVPRQTGEDCEGVGGVGCRIVTG